MKTNQNTKKTQEHRKLGVLKTEKPKQNMTLGLIPVMLWSDIIENILTMKTGFNYPK